ncbi:MBG domain-containing protein [Pseudochelatococcus sp. G4_1912]|uniref:MBG domain-containing protein n=1 Tax=Pseudochelatococcus sp. G4_1912 TaxID=3114288 RepID=UPI0039C73AF0
MSKNTYRYIYTSNLTVTKATLTVTANDASKVYDATAWAGGNGVTYSGFVGSETAAVLGGTLTYGGTSQGAKNAGSYTITAGGLTSSNYNIVYASGTLVITKATLTVTANDASKVYDATAWSGGNGVTYSGFAGSETADPHGTLLSTTATRR